MESFELSIVIVNWNVRDLLRQCLQSLEPATRDLRAEIIVVDNDSRDHSVEMVQNEFPHVKLLAFEENLGFPKANNLAIRGAQGEFVLLLNPDTVAEPETLTRCVETLRGDTRIGALGCKIVYPSGKIQYECARALPSLQATLAESLYLHMLFPHSQFFNKRLLGQWDHESNREVECLSGAFMMLRREAVDQVDGLDEQFFMNYEDIDLCAKLREHGWRMYYLAEVKIVHYHGQSRTQSTDPNNQLATEMEYTFFKQHRGDGAAASYRCIVFFRSLFRIVAALFLIPLSRFCDLKQPRSVLALKLHYHNLLWSMGLSTAQGYTEPLTLKNESAESQINA